MGFTVYFDQAGPQPDDSQWSEIKKRVLEIFERHKNTLRYEYDQIDEPPLVDEDSIHFNGIDEDGHETFFLLRDQRGREFCKTERKPYDAAVHGVLTAVHEVCPDWLNVSDDDDWKL